MFGDLLVLEGIKPDQCVGGKLDLISHSVFIDVSRKAPASELKQGLPKPQRLPSLFPTPKFECHDI